MATTRKNTATTAIVASSAIAITIVLLLFYFIQGDTGAENKHNNTIIHDVYPGIEKDSEDGIATIDGKTYFISTLEQTITHSVVMEQKYNSIT